MSSSSHQALMQFCPGKPFSEMSPLEQITIIRNNRAGRIPPEKPKEKPKKAKGTKRTTRKRKVANPEDKALKLLAKLPAAQREKIIAQMKAKQQGV